MPGPVFALRSSNSEDGPSPAGCDPSIASRGSSDSSVGRFGEVDRCRCPERVFRRLGVSLGPIPGRRRDRYATVRQKLVTAGPPAPRENHAHHHSQRRGTPTPDTHDTKLPAPCKPRWAAPPPVQVSAREKPSDWSAEGSRTAAGQVHAGWVVRDVRNRIGPALLVKNQLAVQARSAD